MHLKVRLLQMFELYQALIRTCIQPTMMIFVEAKFLRTLQTNSFSCKFEIESYAMVYVNHSGKQLLITVTVLFKNIIIQIKCTYVAKNSQFLTIALILLHLRFNQVYTYVKNLQLNLNDDFQLHGTVEIDWKAAVMFTLFIITNKKQM